MMLEPAMLVIVCGLELLMRWEWSGLRMFARNNVLPRQMVYAVSSQFVLNNKVEAHGEVHLAG